MFNEYIKKILEECDVGGGMTEMGVYGNSGTYNTGGDNRIPKILGPMARRLGKKKRRHKKKHS
jgi:hypothetical protein